MTTIQDLRQELAALEIAPEMEDLEFDRYQELEAKVEASCRENYAEKDKTDLLESTMQTYRIWEEEAETAGIHKEYFGKALEEVVATPLQEAIERRAELVNDLNNYRSKDTAYHVEIIAISSTLLSALATGAYAGYTVAAENMFSGASIVAGVFVGAVIAVPAYIPGAVVGIVAGITAGMYAGAREKIKSLKLASHDKKFKDSKKLLSYIGPKRGTSEDFVGRCAEKGIEIDYNAVLERAVEIQQTEYANLEARYDAAEKVIEASEHTKYMVGSFLESGYTMEHLEHQYNQTYGEQMRGTAVIGRVEGCMASIIAQEKESKRKVAALASAEETRRIEEETLAEIC